MISFLGEAEEDLGPAGGSKKKSKSGDDEDWVETHAGRGEPFTLLKGLPPLMTRRQTPRPPTRALLKTSLTWSPLLPRGIPISPRARSCRLSSST